MRWLTLALALSACAGGAPADPPAVRVRADDTDLPPMRELQELVDPWAGRGDAAASPTTRVLAIVGGARADRLAPCGGRATASLLDALVDAHGGVRACDAVAAHAEPTGARAALLHTPDGTSLVEAARALGVRTVFVSGDPADAPLGGAFDVARVAPDPRAMKHPALAPHVDAVLRDVPADTQLLLVIVVPDAQSPWAPVPRERWGRNQEWLDLARGGEADPRVARLRDGTLSLDEEDRFRRLLDAGYDHGLERADLTLRAVLAALVAHGRPADSTRVAVVGDSFTWLGESGRVGAHDVPDSLTHAVPLVLVDAAGQPRPQLPAAPRATDATAWLLTGSWPSASP